MDKTIRIILKKIQSRNSTAYNTFFETAQRLFKDSCTFEYYLLAWASQKHYARLIWELKNFSLAELLKVWKVLVKKQRY